MKRNGMVVRIGRWAGCFGAPARNEVSGRLLRHRMGWPPPFLPHRRAQGAGFEHERTHHSFDIAGQRFQVDVSASAWCHKRLNSSCSNASASVRPNISLSRRTPNTVCTGRLGRPWSSQYSGAKRSSSINGKPRTRKGSAQLACNRCALDAGTRLLVSNRLPYGSFLRNLTLTP